jgi:hypothetical protein
MRRLPIAVLFATFFGPIGCPLGSDTKNPLASPVADVLESMMVDGEAVNSGVHEVTRCCEGLAGAPALTVLLVTFSGDSRAVSLGTSVRVSEVKPSDAIERRRIFVEVRAAGAVEGQGVGETEESPHPPMPGATTHVIRVFVNDCTLSEVLLTLRFYDVRLNSADVEEVHYGLQEFKIVNDCSMGQCTALSDLPDILFAKRVDVNGEDNFQLFGVNPDGTDLRRVTDNTYRDRHPCWSRDGKKLAFTSNRLGFGEDAYEAFLAQGTICDVRRITYETDVGDTNGVREIALSPDGTKLAYSAGGDILVIGTAPGSVADRLTQGAEDDRSPTWSPDGARLAFLRGMELWTMDADGGSDDASILLDRDQVLTAAWSPGPRIAMVRDDPEGVGTLEDDGSVAPFGEGTGPLDGDAIAWSPDGDAIAMHEERETIWIVREKPTTEKPTTAIPVGDPGDRIEGLTWRAP